MSRRNPAVLGQWGAAGTRVLAAESYWRQARRWNDEAARCGVRETVFPSLCDPFEDWSGPIHVGRDRRASSGPHDRATLDDLRGWFFDLIDATPHLDWLLLTKRPENAEAMLRDHVWSRDRRICIRCGATPAMGVGCRRCNVHLLYSVSDQASFDAGILPLIACQTRVATIGLSCEPLLGSLEIDCEQLAVLDWVIAGGESGPHARPCDVAWIRSLRDQCRAAHVPFFLKQLGACVVGSERERWEWAGSPADWSPGEGRVRWKLRDKKGGDPIEWPADLQDCRAFPAAIGGAA
jgi:protein gp37